MANKGNQKKILVILVLIGLIGIAWFIFQKEQDELLRATVQGMDLGERYGKIVKQSQCLPALRFKHGQCQENACELSANGFINSCLRTAEQDDFCMRVPAPGDSQASLAWASTTCSGLKMTGTRCEDYIHQALAVCQELNSGKPYSPGDAARDAFQRELEMSRQRH